MLLEKGLINYPFETPNIARMMRMMARFIDDNLPYSLGLTIYSINKMFQNDNFRLADGSYEFIIREADEVDLKALTMVEWRNFYDNPIVSHNLNAEAARYAQGAIRETLFAGANRGSMDRDDIVRLQSLKPYIEAMAENKVEHIPVLIKSRDVIAVKRSQDLITKVQYLHKLNPETQNNMPVGESTEVKLASLFKNVATYGNHDKMQRKLDWTYKEAKFQQMK